MKKLFFVLTLVFIIITGVGIGTGIVWGSTRVNADNLKPANEPSKYIDCDVYKQETGGIYIPYELSGDRVLVALWFKETSLETRIVSAMEKGVNDDTLNGWVLESMLGESFTSGILFEDPDGDFFGTLSGIELWNDNNIGPYWASFLMEGAGTFLYDYGETDLFSYDLEITNYRVELKDLALVDAPAVPEPSSMFTSFIGLLWLIKRVNFFSRK